MKTSVYLIVLVGIILIALYSLIFVLTGLWYIGLLFLIPIVLLIKVGKDRIKEIEEEKDVISKY